MAKDGFVKIYRQLLDNPVVCKDADHLAVWIYLLLKATHKEQPHMFKGKRITLMPGQFTTARSLIANDLHLADSKVQRVLKCFEIEHQIEQQMSNEKRLITVLNWNKYQENERQSEHPVNSDRTASEQRVNIQQECKNVKNDKNERNIYSPLAQAVEDFKEHRRKLRKPMTDHAVDLLLKKLDELANTDEQKIKLIEYAIERGWQSVFPIQDKGVGSTQKQYNKPRESFERPIGNYESLAIDPFAEENNGAV